MHTLEVRDYSLLVHLGWEAPERAVKQEVRVSLDLAFPEAPKAQETDELNDTVCYRELCSKLLECANQKAFRTIEHLQNEFTDAVRRAIPSGVELKLRVHKVKPPIDGLLGGVVFGNR